MAQGGHPAESLWLQGRAKGPAAPDPCQREPWQKPSNCFFPFHLISFSAEEEFLPVVNRPFFPASLTPNNLKWLQFQSWLSVFSSTGWGQRCQVRASISLCSAFRHRASSSWATSHPRASPVSSTHTRLHSGFRKRFWRPRKHWETKEISLCCKQLISNDQLQMPWWPEPQFPGFEKMHYSRTFSFLWWWI